ncbi:hypothetical protein QYE76_002693 [Lolium multiflorum]|uniref:Zinc knuckle CX2CX4HX4C domain-containing protein n=1 Tax=Lolium multiflorum TaxID=4521 RepID=A0AAD8RM65_LOLMU|nr:hypothetical protein QYE76_002693 [Lolium multiflorum]
MSSAGGGSEKGGSGEDPAHSKPLVDDGAAATPLDRQLAVVKTKEEDEEYDGNWHGMEEDGRNVGPEARLAGEMDMEDEVCMEEEPEEIGPQKAPVQWRLLARYYSLKAANYTVIYNHYREVWKIRGKMVFAPMKDNLFIITFNTEGDYRFVARGGPWIHQGVACLVAPLDDRAQPSEAVLDSIQLWVKFFDVPWNKQNEEYGRLIGSKLGEVQEVDVDAAGLGFKDYLRVRIELPLNRRLMARFKTTITGQPKARIYPIRYERVPHFCFHCGLIGHDKDQCEMKDRGVPSLNYDATLRCSPTRKFMRRTISAPGGPPAKRGLFFSTPNSKGSASSLGNPSKSAQIITEPVLPYIVEHPETVDTHDGFEETEKRTSAAVEQGLAETVDKLNLRMSREQQMPGNQGGTKGPVIQEIAPGQQEQKLPEMYVNPLFQSLLKKQPFIQPASSSSHSGARSSDMIPPLRGLDDLDFTYSSASDVSMANADTVLGKRGVEESEVQGEKLELSLALDYGGHGGGVPKKGKTTAMVKEPELQTLGTQNPVAQKHGRVIQLGDKNRKKAATGQGAPGTLTRPNVWSRQQQ